MAKRYKDEVDYSAGMPQSHCGICKYYIGKENVGHCTKVYGMIRASAWCRLFQKKEGK